MHESDPALVDGVVAALGSGAYHANHGLLATPLQLEASLPGVEGLVGIGDARGVDEDLADLLVEVVVLPAVPAADLHRVVAQRLPHHPHRRRHGDLNDLHCGYGSANSLDSESSIVSGGTVIVSSR